MRVNCVSVMDGLIRAHGGSWGGLGLQPLATYYTTCRESNPRGVAVRIYGLLASNALFLPTPFETFPIGGGTLFPFRWADPLIDVISPEHTLYIHTYILNSVFSQ